jgi:hypothetical protein
MKKLQTGSIKDNHFDDLQASVNKWRIRRNEVVHGMVKSVPGNIHKDILDFNEEAKIVAIQGEQIAKSLCNWYKKVKAQLNKEKNKCN